MYIVQYDICALVLLVFVFISNKVQWKVIDATNRAFQLLIVSTIISDLMDIIFAFMGNTPGKVSAVASWLVNVVYYIFDCMIPMAWARYTVYITRPPEVLRTTRFKLHFYLPYAIAFIAAVTSPLTHFIFTLDANNQYTRGPGIALMYIILSYYIILGTYNLICGHKRIGKRRFLLTVSFVITSMTMVLVQLLVPHLLVQHAGIALAVLMTFSSLQNPADFIDTVSYLYNRKSFGSITSRYFDRTGGFTVILISIDDIDFFTRTFGGDGIESVIRDVGIFLKGIIPYAEFFYLDPGLFAVTVRDNNQDHIRRHCDLVENRFMHNWKNNHLELRLNVHQCVIECPIDAESPEVLIDIINSIAPELQHNPERFLYANQIDVKTQKEKTRIQQLIKTAIPEHRLEVYYQPLWSTKEQCIIGAEALIRMRDDEGKFISPEIFIPMAEQDGSVLRIGQFVFEEVCRFLYQCRATLGKVRMIDVNLSVAQCMQSQLTEDLTGTMELYGLNPSQINLEITETAAAHTPEMLLINMKRLVEAGFSFSLDDYGSGYAGINYLLHLPFCMIKIDKDIVWSSMKDANAYIMLTSTIDMLKKLNMKIVAEGVEDQKMVDLLTELGVDYLQGYYFSKPVPMQEFYDMVKVEPAPVEELINRTPAPVDPDDEEIEELEELEELESID
ncbi:MAG: EAL domain-containing protein [Treponemataceae bacterium]|nr:EAL domain-containing protein [Treponemataceae bacterium]